MSDWIKPAAIALVSAVAGSGGTYSLVEWRLSAIEGQIKDALGREAFKEQGALEQRVISLESQVKSQWRLLRER